MISIKDLLYALDSTDNVVVMTDLDGRITYVNNAFVTTYGYTKNEAIGKSTSILNSGYHDDEFYKNLWSTLLMGETWEGIFRNKTKNETIIWEHARISQIKDDENNVKGYVAVKEDITYKRHLEEQIQHEQFLLNELFNNSPIGITICEPLYKNDVVVDVITIKANPIAGSIFNRLGLVGLTYSKLYPSMMEQLAMVNLMLHEKQSFEFYLPELDKYLSFRTFPIDKDRFCSLFYDVTEYNKSIKAVQESEERYASLVEDTPALICRFNSEGFLTYVNSHFSNSFNIDNEELIGKSFFDLFPVHVIGEMWGKIEWLSPELSMVDFENEMEINGQKRWEKWVIRKLNVIQSGTIEYQAVGMDFTDLKRTEIALIENRNKLNAIVNNDVVGIGVVNSAGKYIFVNSHFSKMTGYSEQELLSLTNVGITQNESKDLSGLMLERLFEGDITNYNIEKKYRRKDGTEFWSSIYLSPIRNPEGKIIEAVGLAADINDKKLIEIQLVENEQKLKELNATKDKLFSIIAHDIKNPFGVILGFSSLLSERFDELSKDDVRLFVNKILEAGENTYKLLEDLLTWGRSQLGKLEVKKIKVVPKDVVDEIFKYYHHLAATKQITLKNGLSPQLMVFADFEMVKFVLRNLVHNGIKFTEGNGVVECFEELSFDPNFKTIIVRDSGIGIHPEKIKLLFDINAFLSTTGTANEKGTGLGLSLAKEMMDKNGGSISVESVVGGGTTFRIELPLA